MSTDAALSTQPSPEDTDAATIDKLCHWMCVLLFHIQNVVGKPGKIESFEIPAAYATRVLDWLEFARRGKWTELGKVAVGWEWRNAEESALIVRLIWAGDGDGDKAKAEVTR